MVHLPEVRKVRPKRLLLLLALLTHTSIHSPATMLSTVVQVHVSTNKLSHGSNSRHLDMVKTTC